MTLRTVRTLHPPRRDDIDGLVTRRPAHRLEQLNPFLFINHHGPQVFPPDNRGLPFGPHPHRGFETVTFIVEGALVHRDSAGHESEIGAGGIQWMTAGRGVEHSETSPEWFRRDGGPLEILQLWINLPSRLKMTAPRYTGVQKEDIPASGGVRLIPIESLTGVTLMTIAGERIVVPAPKGRVVFHYVVRGDDAFHLIEYNDDGDEVEIDARGDSLVIFGHADPIEEPIAAYGPFVMNTQAEIAQAIRDYQAGLFS